MMYSLKRDSDLLSGKNTLKFLEKMVIHVNSTFK